MADGLRIGITGHRPDRIPGGYSASATTRLSRLARQSLEQLPVTSVALGMAQGWDTAVAAACIDAGVPFHAYLPFIGQDERWPTAARDRYARLLAHAASVHVEPHGQAAYAGRCMQSRNERIVDVSDAMLTLWDGRCFGGTWNCLDYATNHRRHPLPVLNVWHMLGA